jgi:hypothetical protein
VQRYSFKLYTPASLSFKTAEPLCVQARERSVVAELEPLKEDVPVLLVIGAQKAGTTWLWGALHRHPAFVGARTCGPALIAAAGARALALVLLPLLWPCGAASSRVARASRSRARVPL